MKTKVFQAIRSSQKIKVNTQAEEHASPKIQHDSNDDAKISEDSDTSF